MKFDVNQLLKNETKMIKQKSDPYAEKVLVQVFTGMQGRYTRLKIVLRVAEEPLNTHQLTKDLGIDYKAVQRNIRVLEKNNLIIRVGENYGSVFYLSPFLESNMLTLKEIIKKVDRKLSSKKVYIS